MRPIKLEMTAFGSYAGPATVPFEALTHGLYLVTGDTGAGKTTIFDAIMFALYGTASGTDRTPDKMHCDYVSKSQDTVVTLTFLQDGREYRVQRSIHFRKKRGAGEEYGDSTVSALLWAPGEEPLEGAQKVTERCTRLLGLNADQFRKIVMLAQGEFREFLKADSDKKNEILGKLFDNSACVYYQELLAGARDELARRRAAQQEKLARTMEETFQLPDGLLPEEAVLYLPGHPALAENLAALIAGEEADLQALEAGRGTAQRALDKLNEEKGRAEGLNAQLAQLEAARARQKELEALRPAMEARAGAAARAARALRGVKPAAARQARAKQDAEKTRQELETLAAALARQEEALAAAQKKSEEAAPLEEEAAALAAAHTGLEKQLPRYAALTQKAGEEAAARQARQAEEAKAAAAAREEEAESLRLAALREELQALEGAEAEFVKREGESEAAQNRWLALAGKSGIRAEAEDLSKEEAAAVRAGWALKEAARLAAAAEEDHHRLYRRFVEGQAGLLAQDLRRRLEEEGTAPCPVCGTPHTRGREAAFAPLPQDTPTREEVEKAKARFDKAEKARQEQDAALQARTAALAARKEALLARAAALPLNAQSWTGLTAPGFLAGQEARLQSEMTACAAALKEAGARKARREACAAEVTEAGEKLKSLSAARQTHSSRAEEQNALCLAAAAAGEEIRRGLDFDSEAEAKARMEAL
ncbi:MAG: AAA family ATPase, partial [Oscillospiraceae bacterium]|nr:AAA family ATPase [Oscillospiraceae bacterium]